MSEQTFGLNYSRSINLLIFIFPIVINLLQVAGDIILFILAMMGIFTAISQKLSPFKTREIRVFSYLTFGYFLAVCLSVIFSGQAKELAHFIPRDFHFLFAPFIALALFKAEINFNYLLTGAKVALLILGGVIFYQYLLGVDRPSGIMNAAVFGNLAVSIFFIIFVFFQHESFKQKIFSLLSLSSGFFIIILSGTRGAWLSFLLLLGVYFYFYNKQKNSSNKKSKIMTLLLIIVLVFLSNFNQSFQNRLIKSYVDFTSWFSIKDNASLIPENIILDKEMVTNGDFLSSSGWKAGNWSIEGGQAVGSEGDGYLQTDAIMSAGNKYSVTFTVTAISGNLFCYLGVGSPPENYSSVDSIGTYTLVRSAFNEYLGFYLAAGQSATIDNVSVKQVTQVMLPKGEGSSNADLAIFDKNKSLDTTLIPDIQVLSSIGIRLEMYRSALKKIKDVPFFGHGYRTSNVVVFGDSENGIGKLSYGFNHLHNAYLTQYFNGGFVLLGALLSLLFVPLRLFMKANIQNRENPIFISGVLLIFGYASFGMVNILFGDTYMNGFYVFFLAIFLLLTNKSIKTLDT